VDVKCILLINNSKAYQPYKPYSNHHHAFEVVVEQSQFEEGD
jgi:hypothetical protein